MGNRPPDTKTSEKSQADQLMPSGESQGTGGGGGGGIQTLRIPLNKVHPPIVRQAREGATVDVRFQNNAYEVFWAGQLIGTVPGSFKPRLAPPTLHRATIVDLSPEPQREKVVIEVAL